MRSTTIYLCESEWVQAYDGACNVQVLNVLEAVPQVAEKRVVEVLEHASLANDIPHALGPYNCDTASAYKDVRSERRWNRKEPHTFIFPNILESKCEPGILSLDDSHFPKSPLPDDSQQPEVVEVHYARRKSAAFSTSLPFLAA
jgi:hypothetical protein